jgi:acetyltransferase
MLPKGGTETIVGISQDPVFGPVIVFGFGGVFVEIMRDVSRRVAPLTRWDAEKMIRELRASAILNGVRGMPRRDVDALIQILLQISEMALHLRDVVAELDINPLVVWSEGQGAKVADALVVLK